tara:strand:- start:847 stop:1818 length:972 start_codon:yes stop_codon:yes gene_type:complete
MNLNKKKFFVLLNKNLIIENNPTIAAAVSGGPDSMGLVFLLNDWCKLINGNLIALIVNHNLRKNSLEEATSTQNILKKKKIKSKIFSVHNSQINKKSMNEARINRYKLLTNYCRSNNILHLFLAHHKDDNLETFLTRKVSGSDFEGLNSMQLFSLNNKINIVRPFLNYTKKEILEYNFHYKIPFVIDPSNTNLNYTRPSIRDFLGKTLKKNIKEIENEFNIIKKYSSHYKTMIYEILIKNTTEISNSYIKINYKNYMKLNKILSVKIVKCIFQYFNKKDIFLRSKKIDIFINEVKKMKFEQFNLGGMIIKKRDNSLVFLKKPN